MPLGDCSSEAVMQLGVLVAVLSTAVVALPAGWPSPLPAPPPSPPLELKVERLVVDVDAGADDAMALLLLLGAQRHASPPALRLQAVTCVNGNTNLTNVWRNVLRLLDVVERPDIPVYAGASESLLFTPKSDNYHGLDGFGDIADRRDHYDEKVQKEHAVNFLLSKASESPGELTLLTLGPLTNVALAERMRKGFVCQWRHLIWMGGAVEGLGNVRPSVEFNTFIDPEALQVVLDASVACGRPLLMVPWEVLMRHDLTIGWRKDVLGALPSKGVQLLNTVERAFLAGPAEGRWMSADSVAVAVALAPKLATRVSAPLHVGVTLGDGQARATLQVDYTNVSGLAPNARIVQDVDSAGLRQLLLDNLA